VTTDNYGGGRMATEHLLQLGVKISVISPVPWSGGKPANEKKPGKTY
jgi:DNA-binding LacI/PurR family transcriptional regulator